MKITSFYTASALGRGNEETLSNYLLHNAPGLKKITGDIPNREIYFGNVEGELPKIENDKWNIRTNQLLELALQSDKSFFDIVKKYNPEKVGIVLGASNTGIDEVENHIDEWLKNPEGDKPEKFHFSMIELGTPAIYLKERLQVKGPAYTVSTACSSATKAFGAARRLIEKGICDVVITGGVDGRCRFAMNGFHALGALSEGLSRPLAEDRDGINLGEAVALFALERDAKEGLSILGIGETSDAYHATAPDPEGSGAESAMRAALTDAGLEPKEIEYLNLHGTGTFANDEMEMKAVNRLFDGALPKFESTKNLTGHCLGAAGAVEAAICALLLKARKYDRAMSNSFAFGGSNACVILSSK